MKKFFDWVAAKCYRIYDYFMICKYPDFCYDDYNAGVIQFIWGVKSVDDLTNCRETNLHTMNDIDITYNRKTKTYSLGIETAYLFENKKEEVDYLNSLLDLFTKFMIQHNYNQNEGYDLWMTNPNITLCAESIPELYTQFKIFVEGYKAVYRYPIQGGDIFG